MRRYALRDDQWDRIKDIVPSVVKLITDLSSVTIVGLDLAKRVFQAHSVDASGRVVAER